MLRIILGELSAFLIGGEVLCTTKSVAYDLRLRVGLTIFVSPGHDDTILTTLRLRMEIFAPYLPFEFCQIPLLELYSVFGKSILLVLWSTESCYSLTFTMPCDERHLLS
jgi:hypothetical protein